MSGFNSSLSQLMATFASEIPGGTGSAAYNEVVSAINASPPLLASLNADALGGSMKGITYDPTGAGAEFNPRDQSLSLSQGFLAAEVSDPYTLIFTLAHEDQHAEDFTGANGAGVLGSLVGLPGTISVQTADTAFNGNLAQSIQGYNGQGPQDLTSAAATYQQIQLWDEGEANIAGWNAQLSAAVTANGGQQLSPAALASLETQGDAPDLFPKGQPLSGLTINADGSITQTAANQLAASQFFLTANPSTGADQVLTYPQIEVAALDNALATTYPNKQFAMNYSTLGLDTPSALSNQPTLLSDASADLEILRSSTAKWPSTGTFSITDSADGVVNTFSFSSTNDGSGTIARATVSTSNGDLGWYTTETNSSGVQTYNNAAMFSSSDPNEPSISMSGGITYLTTTTNNAQGTVSSVSSFDGNGNMLIDMITVNGVSYDYGDTLDLSVGANGVQQVQLPATNTGPSVADFGNGASITGEGSGSTQQIIGNYDNLSLAAASTVTLAGSGDNVTGASGDVVTDSGASNTFTGSQYSVALGASNLGAFDDASGKLTFTDAAGATGGNVFLEANNLKVVDDATGGLGFLDGSGATGGTVKLGANNLDIETYSSGLTVSGISGLNSGEVIFGAPNLNTTVDTTGLTLVDAAGATGGNAIFGANGLHLTDDATGGLGFYDASGVSGGNVALAVNNLTALSFAQGLTIADALGVTGGVIGLASTGDTLNLTAGTVDFNAGSLTATISDPNGQISAGSWTGDAATLTGSNIGATISNGTIDLATAASSATIVGSNDLVNGVAGNIVGFNGAADAANLSGGTINLDTASTSVTAIGSNDVANGVNGAAIGFSGAGDLANLSGGTINLDTAATSVTAIGSHDVVDAVAGAAIGFNGTGDLANLSSGAINLDTASTSVTANGSGDLVNGVAGSTIGFSGAGDTANLSGGTVNFDLNASGTVTGTDLVNLAAGTTVTATANNDLFNVLGSGAALTASNGVVDVSSLVDLALSGSGNTVNLGAGDLADIYGSLNDLSGGVNAVATLENTSQIEGFQPTAWPGITTYVGTYSTLGDPASVTNLLYDASPTSNIFSPAGGGSQDQAFTGLPSGTYAQLRTFSGIDDSGLKTWQVDALGSVGHYAGAVYTSYNYTNGKPSGYEEQFYNSTGSYLGYANFNAHGTYEGGSGNGVFSGGQGYGYGYGGDIGGGYYSGGYYGGYYGAKRKSGASSAKGAQHRGVDIARIAKDDPGSIIPKLALMTPLDIGSRSGLGAAERALLGKAPITLPAAMHRADYSDAESPLVRAEHPSMALFAQAGSAISHGVAPISLGLGARPQPGAGRLTSPGPLA